MDVEVLLDSQHAIIQYLAGSDADPTSLAVLLERLHGLTVLMENLSLPTTADEHAGCGKPDCGRESGGCTSCSTDGGCSSCGSGKVDMKAYFAHLRGKMEERQRTPLL